MRSRHRTRAIGFALLLISGLIASGCGEQPAAPLPANEQAVLHLNAPSGGYGVGPESPAFADAELASSTLVEEQVPEPYAGFSEDPQCARWLRGDSTVVYAVTLLWGELKTDPSIGSFGIEADETGTEGYDWTGYAEFTRGAVRVRSTIAFERNDHIERPRTDRTRLDWVSHTETGFDGLRIALYQPLPAEAEDVLHIVAGTNEWSIPVADLQDYQQIFDVDTEGNQFMVRAFRIDPEVCSRGFAGGGWAPRSDEGIGFFRGRWVGVDGEMAGYVRGHYGVDETGNRVLFGKVIDLDGNFIAILRGSWDIRHETPRGVMGQFRTQALDAKGSVIGSFKGNWRIVGGSSGGFFEGRWNVGCRP